MLGTRSTENIVATLSTQTQALKVKHRSINSEITMEQILLHL